MRALFALAVLAALLPGPVAACRLALVLALDVSSSVDEEEYLLQRNGLARALIAPEVEAAFLSTPDPVALAAYEWSGQWNQRVVLDWRLIRSAEDLLATAEELSGTERGGNESPTALGAAIGYGAGMLAAAPGCEKHTLDVAGDGENNHGYAPAIAYRHFPLGGVTVNALAIGGAVTTRELAAYFRREVISGPGAFVEEARDHADFERAMRRKLEREVAGAFAEARPGRHENFERF